jgi:hypothetical protein
MDTMVVLAKYCFKHIFIIDGQLTSLVEQFTVVIVIIAKD